MNQITVCIHLYIYTYTFLITQYNAPFTMQERKIFTDQNITNKQMANQAYTGRIPVEIRTRVAKWFRICLSNHLCLVACSTPIDRNEKRGVFLITDLCEIVGKLTKTLNIAFSVLAQSRSKILVLAKSYTQHELLLKLNCQE